MTSHTQIIYTAGHIAEAVLLQQLLAERDIHSFIENEVLQGSIGGLPPGEATNPRVRVAADDVDKAREVVKAFEYQQQMGRQRQTEFVTIASSHWTEWPTCPGCGRRRQTVCPICETAGDDLPLADANHGGIAPVLGPRSDRSADAPGLQDRPLLICTTCDEPFAPQFYRLCPWCGHRFEDGIALAEAEEPTAEALSGRAWAVIIALGAVVAAICGYFWWLTAQ